MANLIHQFTALVTKGSVVIESNQVKSFHKCASAHGVKYEIGPHKAGKTVLITI